MTVNLCFQGTTSVLNKIGTFLDFSFTIEKHFLSQIWKMKPLTNFTFTNHMFYGSSRQIVSAKGIDEVISKGVVRNKLHKRFFSTSAANLLVLFILLLH